MFNSALVIIEASQILCNVFSIAESSVVHHENLTRNLTKESRFVRVYSMANPILDMYEYPFKNVEYKYQHCGESDFRYVQEYCGLRS